MPSLTQRKALGRVCAAALLAGCVPLLPAGCKSDAPTEDSTDTKLSAMCSDAKCGFMEELSTSKLVEPSSGSAAGSPAVGPGYKCPKCGKETLYTTVVKCGQCQTAYLPTRDEGGRTVRRCPKCGSSG